MTSGVSIGDVKVGVFGDVMECCSNFSQGNIQVCLDQARLGSVRFER